MNFVFKSFDILNSYLESITPDIISGVVSGLIITIFLSLYNMKRVRRIRKREEKILNKKMNRYLNVQERWHFLFVINEILKKVTEDKNISVEYSDNDFRCFVVKMGEYNIYCYSYYLPGSNINIFNETGKKTNKYFKEYIQNEMEKAKSTIETLDDDIINIIYKYNIKTELENYDKMNEIIYSIIWWNNEVKTLIEDEKYNLMFNDKLDEKIKNIKILFNMENNEECKRDMYFNFPTFWIRSEFIKTEYVNEV